ncbi:unnamed protein product [Calypogeia fissa]
MAFEHQFLQLLELPKSSAASSLFLSPKLKEVLFKGQIHGVVLPDLPTRFPLSTFFPPRAKAFKQSTKTNGYVSPSPALPTQETPDISIGTVQSIVQRAGCSQVRTVAAQLRSMGDIRSRLLTSALELDATGSGGSLLLVSGGHPLRSFPLVERLLPSNSFKMLTMASKLRQAGEIPAGVQLWAVENPLTNTVERLEQKILAGAETVIVQPPLLKDVFEAWWDAAYSRGLMKDIRVLVGLPLITSADNLAFWFSLTQTSGDRAKFRLDELRKVEATCSKDLQERRAFFKKETQDLMRFTKSLPGVAGIHFMPVTPSGWRQFAEILE